MDVDETEDRPTCPRCGAALAVRARFCNNCGLDLYTPVGVDGALARATDWWARRSAGVRIGLVVAVLLVLLVIVLAILSTGNFA